MGELKRAAVRIACLSGAAEAAEQVRAGRMQVLEVVKRELIDQLQPGRRSGVLGDGNRPVELDDRRLRQAPELAIEGGDLRPVARLLGVQRSDRCLDDVWAVAA